MFTTGETVGRAEWIIDNTCLVLSTLKGSYRVMYQVLLSPVQSFRHISTWAKKSLANLVTHHADPM